MSGKKAARPKIRVEVELELTFMEGASSGLLHVMVKDTLEKFEVDGKFSGHVVGGLGGGTEVSFPPSRNGVNGDTFYLSSEELFMAVAKARAALKSAAVKARKRGGGSTA